MMAQSKSVSLAGACVAAHLSCLRWCGFCRLPAQTPQVLRAAHEVYRFFALAATAIYLLQECVYAYKARNDMEKLSRVMFLLLCHITSIVKQAVFHADADRIDALIVSLDDGALQGGSSAVLQDGSLPADMLLVRHASAARRLQRAYAGTAVVTCTLWVVVTVAHYVHTRTVEFTIWLPAVADEPLQFAVVLVYSHYVTTLVGIANTTMDAFVGALLDQYTAQLQILRLDVVGLAQNACVTAAYENTRAHEDVLLRLFYERLKHYNKICTGAQLVERIFGGAILVQFAIGGWILCMAAYKVVSLNLLSVEFASMLLFIVCILTELFLYCYFGNQLTEESARVQDALFACGWELWPRGERRARQALLLARERAQRPLRAVAAGIVPLSLDTFIKILKSSYTFYAVLRQTK